MITVLQQYKTGLILILLTLLSSALGSINFHLSHSVLFIVFVMLIVAIKGQQIIDVFMELSHAPRKWRLLLMSYVIIIPSVIALIYLW